MADKSNTPDESNISPLQEGKWDYFLIFTFSLLWSPIYAIMIRKIEEMGYVEPYSIIPFCIAGFIASTIWWKRDMSSTPTRENRILSTFMTVSVVFAIMMLGRAGLVVKYGK